MVNLGLFLHKGTEGVETNAVNAVRMGDGASRPPTAGRRGGVVKNGVRASELYELAIDRRDDVHALDNLGLLLHHGTEGVEIDEVRGLELYERALDREVLAEGERVGEEQGRDGGRAGREAAVRTAHGARKGRRRQEVDGGARHQLGVRLDDHVRDERAIWRCRSAVLSAPPALCARASLFSAINFAGATAAARVWGRRTASVWHVCADDGVVGAAVAVRVETLLQRELTSGSGGKRNRRLRRGGRLGCRSCSAPCWQRSVGY
ncbi:Sel1-repeat containing protein [Chondrus crispus]|uniref:Sel1-repeat containing protein n=1 Tax=Chondrus crispus TaxID=2769 RepID=R7QSD1_CHOCR|nr:Sel1-repeat containing protein [Chondrus crispus]CDF40648.1 Sel1-repeat containing protein [Chondrus crispus]|eukprot:XP_005710942.1 Sel1-repeat containing protein [Chondrus crispus]